LKLTSGSLFWMYEQWCEMGRRHVWYL